MYNFFIKVQVAHDKKNGGHTMKRLLGLSVILTMVLCIGLTPVALAEEPKAKLSVMYWDNTNLGTKDDAYQWIMDTYEKWDKKDSVEIEMLPQMGTSNDMFTKACLMMQSKEKTPDIYLDDSFQAVSDAAAGYLLDLTPYVNAWPTWTDGSYYEASKSMVIEGQGKIYGIPIETDARGIWMNMDILEMAGLGRDWEPENWQSLLDGLKKIKERCPDVIPIWFKAVGNSEGTTVNNFLQFLLGTDSGLYDWNSGKWNLYSQGMLDTFEFYSAIVENGLTGPLAEICATSSDANGYEYMRNGKCAMQVGGSFVAGAQFAPGTSFEWDGYENILKFVAVPTQYGQGLGHVTVSGGYSLTVPALSDETELAAEFIMEMMDNLDGLCYRVVSNGSLACRNISGANNYATYVEQPFIELATSFLEWTQYRPQVGSYSLVSGYLSTALEAVVCGEEPKVAMETLYNDVMNSLGVDSVMRTLD